MEMGACESCGEVGCDDLVTLQRLYVQPDRDGADAIVFRVDDIERWCAACRTHYPHQLVSEGDEGQPPR